MTNREGKEARKTRCDKKIDVKPTVSIKLKNYIYKFAELSEQPVKDLCESLCEHGQMDPGVLDDLQGYFRRDYFRPPAIYRGFSERPRLKLLFPYETGKITIKFPQPTYDQLCKLSFSLDLPPTTAAAVLLKTTIHNRDFMLWYVQSLQRLNNSQKNTLNAFLRHVWGFK